jgi:TolB-like protein
MKNVHEVRSGTCGALALTRRRMVLGLVASLFTGNRRAAASGVRPTVAVLYFDYQGKNPELEPLRKGLAQILTTDIGELETIRVVERARLEEVLAELELGRSAKVDRASAARIGKLLGAQALVLGSFFDVAGVLRVDARVVEVESGRVVRSVGAQAKADDALACEETLAEKLRSALQAYAVESSSAPRAAKAGASPSPRKGASGEGGGASTAQEPRAKVKVSALAAYGRALDALDRNDRADAKSELEAAVRVSPTFSIAARALAKLPP